MISYYPQKYQTTSLHICLKNTMLACLTTAVITVTASCTNSNERHTYNDDADASLVDTTIEFREPRPTSYIRISSYEEKLKERKVSINAPDISLLDAIVSVIPDTNIIPTDPNVDFTRRISVYANNIPVGKYLTVLTGLTDYEFTVEDNSLKVASIAIRRWNIPAFATKRSATTTLGQPLQGGSGESSGSNSSGGSASTTTITQEEANDQWDKVIENAESILGIKEGEEGDDKAPEQPGATESADDMAAMPPMMGVNPLAAMMGGGPTPPMGSEAMETAPSEAELPKNEFSFNPYVIGVRSIGEISAAGSPSKIRILDQFISNLSRNAHRLINLDVKAYDVNLADSDSKGIDWNVLYRTTMNGYPALYSLTGNRGEGDSTDSGGTMPLGTATATSMALLQQRTATAQTLSNLGEEAREAIGTKLGEKAASILTSDLGAGADVAVKPFSIGGRVDLSRLSMSMLLKFLNKFGKVKLLTQPNITTLNGSTAFISSGNDFYFISKVDTVTDNGVSQTTATSERIKVGLSLSVTARMLDDDRILLDIVPILSELRRLDDLNYGLKTPNIALQELSTQVITRSGVPVKLGGLISNRITEAVARLPWAKNEHGNFMWPLFNNFLFKSEALTKERHELVIVVTPRIVES